MKKETWKFIIQTLAAILTALATSFGVASCVKASKDAHTDHTCTVCGHSHCCSVCEE